MDKTLTIPDSQDNLLTLLSDQEQVKRIGSGPKDWAEFIQTYAKAHAERDAGDLDEQRNAQMAAQIKGILEANGYTPRVTRGRLPDSEEAAQKGWAPANGSSVFRKAHDFNPEAAGAGEQWDNFGEFTKAVATLWRSGVRDARLKDLTEGVLGDGGALVPEEFRAELLRLSLETSVVRPRARVIPMGSASIRFPAIHDTSHASTVYGGITANWKAEAADVSSATNQPNFRQVRIEPYKLTAYTVASNELLADSAIPFEALLGQLFPEAISYFEDDAFINGTGAGQPLGILNADALVAVAKETGQAATTLVYENLLKMYARMLPSSLARAVWVAHPDVLPQLAQMSLAVGTGGSALWVMNASQSVPMSIFGRPLIFSEKCQTLGTAGDIYFVDFGHYLIGDRQALTVARSEHVKFVNDEMVWRFIQRVDGRPWLTSALTPRNGSNTFSPFIDLATRS